MSDFDYSGDWSINAQIDRESAPIEKAWDEHVKDPKNPHEKDPVHCPECKKYQDALNKIRAQARWF